MAKTTKNIDVVKILRPCLSLQTVTELRTFSHTFFNLDEQKAVGEN